MSLRDHPAFRGYDLALLQAHAATPEGCAFLEGHRALIRAHRERTLAVLQEMQESVAIADELLQRFATVLDQGGAA